MFTNRFEVVLKKFQKFVATSSYFVVSLYINVFNQLIFLYLENVSQKPQKKTRDLDGTISIKIISLSAEKTQKKTAFQSNKLVKCLKEVEL